MPRVVFTSQLKRFLDAPEVEVAGETLGQVLVATFEAHPRLRGYILDDTGHVRQHVAIYLDGALIKDRTNLDVPVGPETEIYILQALSGG